MFVVVVTAMVLFLVFTFRLCGLGQVTVDAGALFDIGNLLCLVLFLSVFTRGSVLAGRALVFRQVRNDWLGFLVVVTIGGSCGNCACMIQRSALCRRGNNARLRCIYFLSDICNYLKLFHHGS